MTSQSTNKSFEFFSLSQPTALNAESGNRENITFRNDVDKATFARAGAVMNRHIKAAGFHFDEVGMHMAVVEWAAGLVIPLHDHSENCLYYVESGSILMGNRELGPGDGLLVRANQPYGYTAGPNGARVIEFTCGDKGNSVMNVLDRNLEGWLARVEKAVDALEATD